MEELIKLINEQERQIEYLEYVIRQLTYIILNNPGRADVLSERKSKKEELLKHLKEVYWQSLDYATTPKRHL